MPIDILGPASAVNSTTTRPSETRLFGATDTFFRPCSSPSATDGTAVQAVFLNGLLQQVRRAIRGMGISEDNLDDDMLLKAIQAAQAGLASEAALLANMPVHAFVGSSGLIATTTGVGQIIVLTGQTIIRRGIRSYAMDDISLANRTFATVASRTYHLRWYAPGTGRATPASSWPAGRLFLEDLSDTVGYNPSSLAEANAAFDSTFDNVLLGRVVTNGSNALTLTPLLNIPALAADVFSYFDQTTPGAFTGPGATFLLACSHSVTINWARTPRFVAHIGVTGISSAAGPFLLNGYANLIGSISTSRYALAATVSTDWDEPPPTLTVYFSQLQFKAVN
jgi:hypothetical protein